MNIENKKLTEIKEYENNPRDNADAVKVVIASIKKFKFLDPIEVDEAGIILAGHTRYAAAKKMKMKTVPVIVHTGLTEEQKKAYRIANNSTGEISQWNNERLKVEIKDIKFDMSVYGLNIERLAQGIRDDQIEGLLKKFEDLQPDRTKTVAEGTGTGLQITITGKKAVFTPKIMKSIKGLYAIGAKVEIKETE